MAVANVLRVAILGAMPNGEVWSVNPVYQIGGVSTAEDITADQCLAMATAINAITMSTGITAVFGSTTTWNGTRVEARRWDGTLSSQAEVAKGSPTPGTGATSHPFQTSIVASLRTSRPGASGRGRLYFPATGIQMSTSLRVSQTVINSFVLGVKTFLTSVGTAIDVTTANAPVLSVWSRSLALTTPVTSMQSGDVMDTQRRRRDALVETYSTTSFP